MQSNYFPDCITWNAPQAIFAPVFKDQLDRGCQVFTALLKGVSLTVRSRNLRGPADEPVAVFLDHRCEFVVHR
jgi:hypothetical protein